MVMLTLTLSLPTKCNATTSAASKRLIIDTHILFSSHKYLAAVTRVISRATAPSLASLWRASIVVKKGKSNNRKYSSLFDMWYWKVPAIPRPSALSLAFLRALAASATRKAIPLLNVQRDSLICVRTARKKVRKRKEHEQNNNNNWILDWRSFLQKATRLWIAKKIASSTWTISQTSFPRRHGLSSRRPATRRTLKISVRYG